MHTILEALSILKDLLTVTDQKKNVLGINTEHVQSAVCFRDIFISGLSMSSY